MKETPTTPYLIRAIFEWCCDNALTPYIAVKVDETTRVPMEFVKNGEIVLNLSPDATRNLKIGNELIQFSARFAGISRELSIPIAAVGGIFAKETGQGLAFQAATQPADDHDAQSRTDEDAPDDGGPAAAGRRSHLQVVK
ncbi:MAG TPA: ClpXP protease specificity-enhancing factor [Burkholderiales bacterium]|nr:ClpXP protease specificity-enhancing factor [Burkholderiales bacterium]